MSSHSLRFVTSSEAEVEEILYYVQGRAEQWVGGQSQILGPGDVAHVPMNEVHGTYIRSLSVLLRRPEAMHR